MVSALMDYPVDVVIWSLAKQRATSEFWPAEAEVRRLCEQSVSERLAMRNEAERLVREMEAEEARRRASAPQTIRGPAAEFIQRGQARCTPGQKLSYFSRWGMRIEGDIVWVKAPIGETMVKRIAGDIADELGLTIKRCRKIPSSFPVYDGPPPTAEEKAEFLRRLNALADEMRFAAPARPPSPDKWHGQKRTMASHVRSEDDQ